MRKHFPLMNERPEFPRLVIGLIYGVLAFFSMPFLMLILIQGSFENEAVMNGVEIVYHIINGVAGLYIMWEYVKECVLYAPITRRDLLQTVAIGTGIILVLANLEAGLLGLVENDYALWASYGIVPFAELDLFTTPSYLAHLSPIFGTLSLSVFAPIAMSCLFYAVVFAPICCKKPWLAYLVMAIYLAFPRLCNGLTHWDLQLELALYAVHLPLHMVACWTYQKTDTILAPMATLAAVNFLTCLYWILQGMLMV